MIKVIPLLFLLCLLTGCTTHHETYLTKSLEKDFSDYKNVGILPIRNTAKTDIEIYPDLLKKMVAAELLDLKLFKSVIALDGSATQEDMQGLDLLIKHKIIKNDQPNAAVTIFAPGMDSADVEVEFNFVDLNTNETVGSIGITGDSKNKAQQTIGGLGVGGAAPYTKKALENIAAGLGEYVIEHHKDAVKEE